MMTEENNQKRENKFLNQFKKKIQVNIFERYKNVDH